MAKKSSFILTLASVFLLITPLVIAEDNIELNYDLSANTNNQTKIRDKALPVIDRTVELEESTPNETATASTPNVVGFSKEERMEKMAAYKEGMLARKAEREQKREDKMTAFKEKLETISDDKKKQIVERVNNRLNTVNENRITAWTQMLEKFSNILDRIQIKTNELKATGADVSTIESQITEAEAALATAQSALDAQAAKDYTITLSDESALRTDVVTMKDTLKTDLKTVHAALKSAHQAIREAAEALHQVQKPTDVGESEITE